MYVCVIYYNGLPLGSPRCPQGLSMLLSLKAFSTLTLGCRSCMKPKMAALSINVRADDDTDGESIDGLMANGFDTAFDNTQEVLRANAADEEDEEDEEELFEEEDAEEEVPRETDEP